MRTEIAIISALALVLSVPLAFAQVETMTFPNGTTVEVETFPEPISFPVPLQSDEIYEEAENVTIYYTDRDGIGVAQIHYPYFLTEQGNYVPYRLTQNDSMAQIEFNNGKMVFDKNAGAITLFKNGNQVVDSDSYLVRTAQLNSDEWTFLDVNDSPIETIIEEEGDKVTITFRQQNNEGIFDVEHVFQGEIKTTAKFTNFIYPDHKFAFTQTLNLSDNIITLNDQEINLDDFVGQTFPREVLEQNEDLVLLAKDLHYNSGIGFDNLWSVGIFENNKIALDYANVEQTQTAIGETVELDPTYQAPTSGWVVGGFICNSSQYSRFNEATDNANYLTGNNNMYQGIHCGCSGSSPSNCGTIHKAVRFDLGATYDIAYIDTHHSGYGWWYGYHPTLTGSINGNTFLSHTGSVAYNAANTQVLHHSSTVNTQARYIDYTLGGYSAYKTLVEVRPFLNLATVSTAPQSLTTSQSTANEIILNWSAPSDDGGASITNYKVYLGGTLIDTIGNVLTYTDTISGSEIGSGLTYHVIAVNSVGDSPSSNNSVITSWDVPDQVTGLSAVTGSPITMTWNTPSSDDTITNYKIYRDGTLLNTIGVTNSYSDSTGVPATSYDYSVSAVSAVGEGQQSATSTAIYGIPPDSPSLVLTHDSSNLNISVAINNGASMGTGTFTQWNIERSADGSTNWTSVGNPTTTPFTDTVPSAGDWYYRATTQSDHGTSAYSSIVNIAHVDPDLPSITASYYDPNSSDIQVVITDGASFGTGTFTSYSIERSADGSTGWTVVGTPTTSPFIDTTTPSVGDWYYRATTTTAHGTSAYSSNALVSPVAPDVPTNLTSVISNPDPSPLTISLDWDSPINFGSGTLTGYEVYRDGSLITTTGTASQYDDTVSVQGTYVYTIKTVTNHAVSSLSGSTTISTPTQPSADSSVTLSIDNPNPNPLDITVSIIAPSSNGGSAITGYNIFSSPDDITYTLVSSNVNTAQTITVANSGTWYFKSQATNNVGTSAVGSAVSIATPTVPSSPLNASSVIGDVDTAPYEVTVTWETPSSTGGSDLTQYNVYRKQGSGAYSLLTTTTGLSITDTVPTSLSTNFTYKIHSQNNVGESTTFDDTTITTFDVPDAPVLSFTTGTTALSWTVPSSDASITGYEIFRDGSSLTTVTTTSHSDFTPINFGQSYQYEVQAVSSLGNSADSNSIVTTPETEITGMIVQGITGTGAVIDWEEPAYYQGQITSYSVYYSTPAQSANPTTSAGTTTNTYSNFAPTLDYDTSYTFGVTITSPLGNSGFSNLVNATTGVDNSIVAYDPTSGGMEWFDIDSVNEQTVNVIEFQRETQNLNINGTFTDVDTLQVGYPSWWDQMTCEVDYKFAQKTEQYVEGTDMTAVVNSADANQQVIGFEFHDIENEVIEVECAPQVSQHDDEVSAKFIMTQQSTTGVPNIPLVAQIQAFQTGDYGTDGDFGALDVVGLFVILISMVGFNRLNPIVGVLLSASLVFGLSFFGVISLPTVLVGVVALVIFLAWGITRNR